MELQINGKTDKALAEYDKSTALNPRMIDALNNRADIKLNAMILTRNCRLQKSCRNKSKSGNELFKSRRDLFTFGAICKRQSD